MKPVHRLIAGISACLLLALGAYIWIDSLLGSIDSYRSPLHANPPAPGQTLAQPASRQVVLVLIDGLRVDTSLKADIMPTLGQLRRQGASTVMHSRTPSFSEPGYSTLLTGAWPEINDGPIFNLSYENTLTWTQDNLFSAAHRAGLKTAVSGYYWFEKLIPQGDVDASFYTPGEENAADRDVVDAALPWLGSEEYSLVLIHIDQVDYAGHHEGGPRDPRWDQAAARSDSMLAEILGRLDLAQDTILVFSDHGHIDAGGHGGHDPVILIEPLVMVGAGVQAGQYADIEMVDLAPTVAALLGTNLPASGQGLVRGEMLDLPAETLAAYENARQEQQATLMQLYMQAIATPAAETVDAPDVKGTVAQGTAALQVMEAARDTRLQEERAQRIAVALVLALISLVLMVHFYKPVFLWLLGGAGLYAALFNFRYSLLDGLPYSFSSILDPTTLILYSAVTASVALLAAWLMVSLRLGLFRMNKTPAALNVLRLTLVVLWLTSLPALWNYAMNGFTLTWTMPDFASVFLGLLSLVQLISIAVLGPVLIGVTALIARARP